MRRHGEKQLLAYVFWHWPQPEITLDAYTQSLAEFHQTLSTNKPAGFFKSIVFNIENATWLQTNGTAFEDWYLQADSASLDKLNDGAVSGACAEPHNNIARHAAGGIAGLYRLRAGEMNLMDAKFAYWFSKPAGVSYPDLYYSLEPITSRAGAGLWGRFMTLGPTTEFCLHSVTQVSFPKHLKANMIKLELCWPHRQ